MTPLVKNIFRFFLFIAAQLLLKNQQLHNLVAPPYIYFIFIIWFPMGLPRKAELIIAMIYGLIWDSFANTYGMHAAACLLLMYIRPYVLNMFLENRNIEVKYIEPHPKLMGGYGGYTGFVSILIFTHHLFLFLVQTMQVGNFAHLLAKLLISFFISLILVFIFEMLMPRLQELR